MGHSGAGTYRAGISHGQSYNAGIGYAGGDLTAANLWGVLSIVYVFSRTTALAAASQGTCLKPMRPRPGPTGGPATKRFHDAKDVQCTVSWLKTGGLEERFGGGFVKAMFFICRYLCY